MKNIVALIPGILPLAAVAQLTVVKDINQTRSTTQRHRQADEGVEGRVTGENSGPTNSGLRCVPIWLTAFAKSANTAQAGLPFGKTTKTELSNRET